VVYESFSVKDTFLFAERLGLGVTGGQVYCLNGDLGVGKTVFAKGFAKGVGVCDEITSPTFCIVNEYSGRVPFYHFDVYRIEDIEEMENIGYLDYFYGGGVCLVEWAELIEEILPENAVFVCIEKDLGKGLDYRKIIIGRGDR